MATASSSQSSPAPPSPQQPSGGNVAAPIPATAATPAPGATRLSFDEVAKHFNVPIAEAATTLVSNLVVFTYYKCFMIYVVGVCSSVLKRICRENGVIRWPYRKFALVLVVVVEEANDLVDLEELKSLYAPVQIYWLVILALPPIPKSPVSSSAKDGKQRNIGKLWRNVEILERIAALVSKFFLAGKTVDDIKKDAAREKGKEFAELSRIARDRLDHAASIHSALALPASALVTGHTQEASKLQRGLSLPDHIPLQQGTKLFPDGHGIFQPLHSIPNYVDEFKYGFPADGLSSATPQWWGSFTGDSTERRNLKEELQLENEKPQDEGSSSSTPDEAGDAVHASKPVSLLCSIRQRAVVDGEESNKLGVSRGYGHCKLGKKERSILVQVFKSSLPYQWKYYFS
ncbi:hypothetical protein Taro_034778 [Colocasia esculenta]|uniref:RWP-RK domain-containing protein n=1 Tax=Colocasia esculenta TaxID=4460 RepID=A0A843W4W8_COLES|nr:hypothetical protein [Colocasia esculenta]